MNATLRTNNIFAFYTQNMYLNLCALCTAICTRSIHISPFHLLLLLRNASRIHKHTSARWMRARTQIHRVTITHTIIKFSCAISLDLCMRLSVCECVVEDCSSSQLHKCSGLELLCFAIRLNWKGSFVARPPSSIHFKRIEMHTIYTLTHTILAKHYHHCDRHRILRKWTVPMYRFACFSRLAAIITSRELAKPNANDLV